MLLFILLWGDRIENYYTGEPASSWWKFLLALSPALIIFLVTHYRDRWKKNNEKEESELDLLGYVVISLDAQTIEVERQRENIVELIEYIKKDDSKLSFKFNTSLTFDWYESIDKIDFLKYFMKYYPADRVTMIEHHRKFLIAIQHIKQVNDELKFNHRELINRLNEFAQSFRDSYKSLTEKVWKEILPYHKTELIPTPFVTILLNTMKKYGEDKADKQETIHFIYEHIVTDIHNLCVNEKDLTFRVELVDLKHYYSRVKDIEANYIILFDGFNKNFITCNNDIKAVVTNLKQVVHY